MKMTWHMYYECIRLKVVVLGDCVVVQPDFL